MSKIVFLCFRNCTDKSITPGYFTKLSERLMPDNISANPPTVIKQNGILLGILNPNSSLPIKNTSVCAGHMIEPLSNWWVPSSPLPDGTYAMFRSNDETVELATDILASRSIWYVQTENMFMASTSQRAIVFFLESFKLNETALVWMLSSGSLGWGNSWDKRIKLLTPDTRLYLDRASWKLKIEEAKVDFHFTGKSEQQYELELSEALNNTFNGLSFDYSKWALLLSGGVDSRQILLKLKEHKELQCVTRGYRSELTDEASDPYIAKQVAEHFGLPHRYFELDSLNESLEKVFNRFISTSESRTDNKSHCLDGFRTLKSLFDLNFSGVIRADEVFGWPPLAPFTLHRQHVGVLLLRDYDNMQGFRESVERKFGEQLCPEHLKQREDESVATWGDRLLQQFRIPVHIAAWNEPIYAYLEIAQPYLSRSIVSTIRTIPDSLRTHKILFRKIATSDSSGFPYAKHERLDAKKENILETPEALTLIFDTLNSDYYRELFSSSIIKDILEKLSLNRGLITTQESYLRKVVKFFMPESVQDLLRSSIIKHDLNYYDLGFRTFLAGEAIKMFNIDAKQLAGYKKLYGETIKSDADISN